MSSVGIEWLKRPLRPAWRTGRAFLGSLNVALAMGPRLCKVLLMRLLRRSDYQRWTSPAGLEEWWDSRTVILAEMVPSGTRLIEFGAGRRRLEHFLAGRCAYYPADLVDRGPGTLVFDLNKRPLPDLTGLRLEVAVFGGVLEYVVDVPGLVAWLGQTVSCCVASYAYVAPRPGVWGKVRDRIRRMGFGYMNHFTEEELASLFAKHGFDRTARRSWEAQCLSVFQRDQEAVTRTWAPSRTRVVVAPYRLITSSDHVKRAFHAPIVK